MNAKIEQILILLADFCYFALRIDAIIVVKV